MNEFEKQVLKRLSKIEQKLGIIDYDPKNIPKKRNRLHEIVNSYAQDQNISYEFAWSDLYRMCKLYLHIDFVERAKNKHVRPIDYICGNGYVDRVLEVAREELL